MCHPQRNGTLEQNLRNQNKKNHNLYSVILQGSTGANHSSLCATKGDTLDKSPVHPRATYGQTTTHSLLCPIQKHQLEHCRIYFLYKKEVVKNAFFFGFRQFVCLFKKRAWVQSICSCTERPLQHIQFS